MFESLYPDAENCVVYVTRTWGPRASVAGFGLISTTHYGSLAHTVEHSVEARDKEVQVLWEPRGRSTRLKTRDNGSLVFRPLGRPHALLIR